jgi:hypothetical protein
MALAVPFADTLGAAGIRELGLRLRLGEPPSLAFDSAKALSVDPESP